MLTPEELAAIREVHAAGWRDIKRFGEPNPLGHGCVMLSQNAHSAIGKLLKREQDEREERRIEAEADQRSRATAKEILTTRPLPRPSCLACGHVHAGPEVDNVCIGCPCDVPVY